MAHYSICNLNSLIVSLANIVSQYDEINENNIDSIIQNEIGKVFLNVLLDAGVFKRTPEGQKAFDKFIKTL